MKVLALYLPQYHRTPDNDRWWGEGYTDWVAAKKAVKYYPGHRQPRVPLNDNYYDLADPTAQAWQWQAGLAKKYGVYGFVVYHYWFGDGKKELYKPMEILLQHPEIDTHYSFCWANLTWRRNWYGVEREVLIKQQYGDKKDWEDHFNYLLQFFKDKRYIKIDNKPIFHIYHSYEIEDLGEMIHCWNDLAKKNGFKGIYWISGNTGSGIDTRTELFDAYYNYEPSFTMKYALPMLARIKKFIKTKWQVYSNFRSLIHRRWDHPAIIDSRLFYANNLKIDSLKDRKCYLGTFCGYDDTPRRQQEGMVFDTTPEDFLQNLRSINSRLHQLDRDDDFVYVTAWNEWGEGAYLEPDTDYEYAYLEAIQAVLGSTKKA